MCKKRWLWTSFWQNEFGKDEIQETKVQIWVFVFVEDMNVQITWNKWVHKNCRGVTKDQGFCLRLYVRHLMLKYDFNIYTFFFFFFFKFMYWFLGLWSRKALSFVMSLPAYVLACVCLPSVSLSVRPSVRLSVRPSVCPSVRKQQLCSHWTDFRELCLFTFRKSPERNRILLKSDNNIRSLYMTHTHL